MQAQDNLQPDLRQRDRELTEIAKSIADLAVLFKDLSSMVIDQGTLLDSVEYNIEQTAVQVSQAVKELNVATKCVFFNVIFTSSPPDHKACAALLSCPGTRKTLGGGAVYSSFYLSFSD